MHISCIIDIPWEYNGNEVTTYFASIKKFYNMMPVFPVLSVLWLWSYCLIENKVSSYKNPPENNGVCLRMWVKLLLDFNGRAYLHSLPLVEEDRTKSFANKRVKFRIADLLIHLVIFGVGIQHPIISLPKYYAAFW